MILFYFIYIFLELICYNKFGGFMKKNIIFVSVIITILIIFLGLSMIVMYINDTSGYKFNENITKDSLINLSIDNEKLVVEDNYMYVASNWESEITSSLLKVNYDSLGNITYSDYEEYDRLYNTDVGVAIGDHYKKVLAYYGIEEGYAYWNVEMKNEDIYFYNYPSDIVKDDNLANAYLNFLYYLEDGKWKLLHPNKYKNKSGEVIAGLDEYVLFRFEFSFNGYSSAIKDDTLAAYSIFHYKKES